jgi:A/G-specific adenine glycosylase
MDYGVHLKQLHPNPGRRSRHHVQQSRFEGSNRQLRSRLLRVVMSGEVRSASELAGLLGAEIASVENNLVAMEREGFLKRTGSGYMVSNGTQKG